MILVAALSLALAAQADPVQFKHGGWAGRCYRQGYLDGRDHELCEAMIFVETGAKIERSADGLTVEPYPGEGCTGEDAGPGHLPSAALDGRDRATKVATYVRAQILAELKACRLTRPIPAIRQTDIAAFLRASDGLKAGSFLLLDAAARAPAAEKCGKQFEQAWREGVKAHPIPAGARVDMMMYTFSKTGQEHADKRIAALPAMLENYFAMYMGPGGMVLEARKPAEAWRDPPSEWFVTLCDVGIEAWSSFIELAVYPEKDGTPPIFGVRLPTGIPAGTGFLITQQPLIAEPQKAK
jgi:hypothetical protein